MAETTIKVPVETRDRLAALARERGTTIRDLVSDLAAAEPTAAERAARVAANVAVLRDNFGVTLTESDLAAGEAFWRAVQHRGTAA
jgi:hypothetical protein